MNLRENHSAQITKIIDAGFKVDTIYPFRYSVTATICGKSGFQCYLYYDQGDLAYPPDFIPNFNCKLHEIMPAQWKNNVNEVVKPLNKLLAFYSVDCKLKIIEMNNSRLNTELMALPSDCLFNISNELFGTVIIIEVPLEKINGYQGLYY